MTMDDTVVMTRTMLKRFRTPAAIVLLVLLILALIPLFISLEQFRPEIEKNITDALGQEVKLGKLQLYLLPVPRLRIGSLQISGDELKADKIDIYPRLSALLDKRISIRHIRINELSLRQSFIENLSQSENTQVSNNNDNSNMAFQLDRISIDQLHLYLANKKRLGPYALKVFLTKELIPSTAWLEAIDGSARLDLKAKEKHYALALQASDWQVPVGPAWQLQDLTAIGKLNKTGLIIESLKAQLYDGMLEGSVIIDWQTDWKIDGNMQSNKLQLEPFLAEFLEKPVIAGALTGKGAFSLLADTPAKLGKQPDVQAEFLITDGVIYNADLEKATDLLSQEPVKGGQTPFSELSGRLAMQAGAISLRELDVKSNTLEAKGKLNIAADETLSGVIEVGVSKTGSLVSVPIKISGTMQAPSLRPTNEALVGGAVGTGLLGPGLGTALGVKAGSFITNLFSDGNEKKVGSKKEPVDQTDFYADDEESD